MFVRVKTSPNFSKKAVQIVENVRDGNKVKQSIVRHVETAFNDDELIRQSLVSVQISIVCYKTTGHLYGKHSAISQQAKEIYKSVGLKLSNIPFLIS